MFRVGPVALLTSCVVGLQLLVPGSAQTCRRSDGNVPRDISLSPGSGTTHFGAGCSYSNCRQYDNDSCDAWVIRCSSGRHAQVTFTDFDTERGYDYVYVWNGDGSDGVRTSSAVRTISGSRSVDPPTQTGTGQSMLVAFQTDGSATRSGWTATATCSSSSSPSPPRSSSYSESSSSRSRSSSYSSSYSSSHAPAPPAPTLTHREQDEEQQILAMGAIGIIIIIIVLCWPCIIFGCGTLLLKPLASASSVHAMFTRRVCVWCAIDSPNALHR